MAPRIGELPSKIPSASSLLPLPIDCGAEDNEVTHGTLRQGIQGRAAPRLLPPESASLKSVSSALRKLHLKFPRKRDYCAGSHLPMAPRMTAQVLTDRQRYYLGIIRAAEAAGGSLVNYRLACPLAFHHR